MTTPFHRLRFVLRATRDIQIPGQQGAMLYALLCQANQPPEGRPAYPRDLLLDAPEQTRTIIAKDALFAFGGTLLANRPEQTTECVERLRTGLTKIGRQGKPRRNGLGGNFRVHAVQDLIADRDWDGGPLQTLGIEHLDAELHRLVDIDEITLRFLSPVRMERPGRRKQARHSFFDERFFDPVYFVRRLLRRMRTLGVQLRDPDDTSHTVVVQLVDRQLIWLDVSYGGRRGKTLGGVVGRVTLRVGDPVTRAALVWGQYSRVGKSTSFGFGAFRIDQLGDAPFPCRRGTPLLETAWNHSAIDRLAMQAGREAGIVSQSIQDIRQGTYRPHPCNSLEIGQGEKRRLLKIPSRRDRVLQRLVLAALGPGIDQLFESSSFAWRKGLGRHSSARALSRAYQQGYRHALRADFDRFFDSVVHAVLEPRLLAYTGDPATVRLIMLWIRSAMGAQPVGLPTGAPLSPLLGNILLDRFDERISQQAGRLVRYGDDFLVLFKDEDDARRMFDRVQDEVQQLALALNETKPDELDLDEPFQFLGFQFERFDRWSARGPDGPQRIEQLGWFDARRSKVHEDYRIRLPGETGENALDFGWTAIVGPGATHFEVQADAIRCHYAQGRRPQTIPLADLETLVVLGNIGIASPALSRLNDLHVDVILADNRGRPLVSISGDFDVPADVLTAQVQAAQDTARRLAIARSLVGAKIHNYARLAAALPDGSHLAARLDGLLPQLDPVDSVQSLLGQEGFAAAIWYESLPTFLGPGFRFQHRVAPNAGDPVNVLLNIAFTLLYRLTSLAARSAGLAPSMGLLHTAGARFQSLASDLQEPLRVLAERAVIEATHRLRARDFTASQQGPYALVVAPEAARWFQKHLWKTLHLGTTAASRSCEQTAEPISYLVAMQRQARSLRRHLLNPSTPFEPLRIP